MSKFCFAKELIQILTGRNLALKRSITNDRLKTFQHFLGTIEFSMQVCFKGNGETDKRLETKGIGLRDFGERSVRFWRIHIIIWLE